MDTIKSGELRAGTRSSSNALEFRARSREHINYLLSAVNVCLLADSAVAAVAATAAPAAAAAALCCCCCYWYPQVYLLRTQHDWFANKRCVFSVSLDLLPTLTTLLFTHALVRGAYEQPFNLPAYQYVYSSPVPIAASSFFLHMFIKIHYFVSSCSLRCVCF